MNLVRESGVGGSLVNRVGVVITDVRLSRDQKEEMSEKIVITVVLILFIIFSEFIRVSNIKQIQLRFRKNSIT